MFFILFLVGGIFTLVGLLFLKKHLFYKEHGQMIRGTVIGVEEYVSRSHDRKRTTYYSPIIEFPFGGDSYLFQDGGSSNGLSRYKIGQSVKLLSHPKGPEYIYLSGGVGTLMMMIFLIVGLVCLGIGAFNLYNNILDPRGFEFDWFGFIPVIFFFFFIISIIRKIKKAIKKAKSEGSIKDFKFDFNKETLISREELKDKKVYYSQAEIKEKLAKFQKVGLIVSLVFCGGIGFVFHLFWNTQPQSFRDKVIEIISDASNWGRISEFFSPRVNEEFVVLLAIGFFFIVSLYALIKSLRNSTAS